jgi:hypothetical protein
MIVPSSGCCVNPSRAADCPAAKRQFRAAEAIVNNGFRHSASKTRVNALMALNSSKGYMRGMAPADTTMHASSAGDSSSVDMLILATVNAPYKRNIGSATLQACLAEAKIDEWQVHVATFFTDVSMNAMLGFADAHGISRHQLADAYRVMKATTGERNPRLEAELAELAPASR